VPRLPAGLNQNCVAAQVAAGADPATCIFPEVAAPHVTTPLFITNSKYDPALDSISGGESGSNVTNVNRLGARLMGISSTAAGRLSFTMAAFIGALSGLLISPTTTIFYDSGFLIGLKGFVAAVFAGLSSYPGAALGAVLVGLLESFSSFWASAFKEVIVFTSILPVLLWRSLRDPHTEEH